MKKLSLPLVASLALILFTVSSCSVAGGIFKAGFWTAIIIVVIVVILILWLVSRSRK